MWIVSFDIRSLTDKEKAKIKEVKQIANGVIKVKQKALKNKIREIKKRDPIAPALFDLEAQLTETRLITGQPGRVSIDNESIVLDYGLLRKLDKSLSKRFPVRTMRIGPCTNYRHTGKSLLIEYQSGEHKGTIQLYELPAYQTELLQNLPIIEV